jgi:subtilisin family serine protease
MMPSFVFSSCVGDDVVDDGYVPPEYSGVADAIEYAWSKGVILVAGAGNSRRTERMSPASYPHVISVAALKRRGRIARFSTKGKWVDFASPGVDMRSNMPNGDLNRCRRSLAGHGGHHGCRGAHAGCRHSTRGGADDARDLGLADPRSSLRPIDASLAVRLRLSWGSPQ